jgi:hypothetical protein
LPYSLRSQARNPRPIADTDSSDITSSTRLSAAATGKSNTLVISL